jgi:hypothetical protein
MFLPLSVGAERRDGSIIRETRLTPRAENSKALALRTIIGFVASDQGSLGAFAMSFAPLGRLMLRWA